MGGSKRKGRASKRDAAFYYFFFFKLITLYTDAIIVIVVGSSIFEILVFISRLFDICYNFIYIRLSSHARERTVFIIYLFIFIIRLIVISPSSSRQFFSLISLYGVCVCVSVDARMAYLSIFPIFIFCPLSLAHPLYRWFLLAFIYTCILFTRIDGSILLYIHIYSCDVFFYLETRRIKTM